MEEVVYKGFTGREILLMFQFISVYDAWKTRDMNDITWDNIVLPEMLEWYDTNKDLSSHLPFEDEILHVANNKDNQLKSLLYHFRNAIAHGQIEKNEGQISLIDMPNSGSEQRSAIGIINAEAFFSFIHLFIL